MTNLKVRKDNVVSIEYTVQLEDGEVIDASEGKGPLQYIHGHQMIIEGLEEALSSMEVGETKEVVVPPEKAYGEYIEEAQEWLAKELFPAEVRLEPGEIIAAKDSEGGTVMLHIKEVEDQRVLVDYNHPLAGETLQFDVKVVDIRPATPQELEHGHVHGEHTEHHH
jgi:FKBP-type peptidyl-prolyl cis-trans isomerase SlyD